MQKKGYEQTYIRKNQVDFTNLCKKITQSFSLSLKNKEAKKGDEDEVSTLSLRQLNKFNS